MPGGDCPANSSNEGRLHGGDDRVVGISGVAVLCRDSAGAAIAAGLAAGVGAGASGKGDA